MQSATYFFKYPPDQVALTFLKQNGAIKCSINRPNRPKIEPLIELFF